MQMITKNVVLEGGGQPFILSHKPTLQHTSVYERQLGTSAVKQTGTQQQPTGSCR